MRRIAGVASLITATFLLLSARLTVATSGRALYPQLVGLKAVSVFVVSHLADLDSDNLTLQVKERLLKGGLRQETREKAPQFVVHIFSNSVRSPFCPEMVSVQVVVTLEEDVRVKRVPKASDLRGTTWQTEGFPTILPAPDASDFAVRESLSMAESFADDVSYSTSVYANTKGRHP